MNQYVTGSIIKRLRGNCKMTQLELAERLCVSAKAVSKWETGKGFPDITLLESLAGTLGVSVTELISGCDVTNTNQNANMLRAGLYVCPVCGNILYSVGEAVISCHGIVLPSLTAEEPDDEHKPLIERYEDEYYVRVNHIMSKEHYISFMAAFSDNSVQIVKLYPEGPAEAYFKISETQSLYCYCNRDGLFKIKL